MLAGGVIIPLIVYLTEGKRDEYVRHHASECLNFQITFMAFWFGSFLLFFGTAVVGASTDSPPWPIFFVFPLMFIAMFGAIGLSIYGAVQASRGVRWRYPLRPARRPRLTRIHSYARSSSTIPGLAGRMRTTTTASSASAVPRHSPATRRTAGVG